MAQIFLDAMSYHEFEDFLALLIYGLVLFPNLNQFIGHCHQHLPRSQSSAYIAQRRAAFTPYSYYEETRDSYVLYAFALSVVYFTPSSVSNEE